MAPMTWWILPSRALSVEAKRWAMEGTGWKARWKAGRRNAEARSDRAMPLEGSSVGVVSPMGVSVGRYALLEHLEWCVRGLGWCEWSGSCYDGKERSTLQTARSFSGARTLPDLVLAKRPERSCSASSVQYVESISQDRLPSLARIQQAQCCDFSLPTTCTDEIFMTHISS